MSFFLFVRLGHYKILFKIILTEKETVPFKDSGIK